MIIIKYIGSKNRIAKEIIPIIQKCIDDNNITEYIEPFVGGANMIDKIQCNRRIGIDSNEYLIEFWKQIQSGWNPFLRDNENTDMTRELYNDVKNNPSLYPKYIVALCGFCATYNAKWFGGYAGIVHTKAGTKRNYYDEAVRNVLSQKKYIDDVVFNCDSYENTKNINNIMIYCDPPYQSTLGYKDRFDSNKYWDWVREQSKNNYILCSEYQAPYDFIEIWSKELITTVDNASRSKAIEKLFTYKDGLYYKYINS